LQQACIAAVSVTDHALCTLHYLACDQWISNFIFSVVVQNRKLNYLLIYEGLKTKSIPIKTFCCDWYKEEKTKGKLCLMRDKLRYCRC
jgi:hypothetical protein